MPHEVKDVPVNAVYKAFALLELLSEGVFSLAEISRRADMPKSSASRFLSSLIDLGVVAKRDDGGFTLTSRLFAMGGKALDALDLVPVALSHMRDLNEETSETVHLAVRSGQTAVYLYKVDSPHSLRMYSRVGYQAPLHCTSLGKCLLAWMDPDRGAEIIRGMAFEKVMPNTIADAEIFRRHLVLVREQGYACDDEENEENVICFGAPVFNGASQAIAAVSISMPMFRFAEYDKDGLVRALCRTASRISQTFGYRAQD